MMHLQLTCSILEGCRGGKFWLSRSGCWEPESGRLYRDTLARNVRFYQALAELPVEWTGAATVLPETPPLNFPLASRSDSNRTWSTQVLGKMGIPFHFTTSPGGIVTLAGSRLYTSMADTPEIIDEALNRFEEVFRNVRKTNKGLLP